MGTPFVETALTRDLFYVNQVSEKLPVARKALVAASERKLSCCLHITTTDAATPLRVRSQPPAMLRSPTI